jgi:hypothetical protein
MHNLQEICSGKYFVIPENQRGFSWTRDQAEAIFSDLRLAGANAHYMGPIIVSRTKTADFPDDETTANTAEYHLEDGQQRLATIFMIANEIRARLEAEEGAGSLDARELGRLLFYHNQGKKLRLQNKNVALGDYYSFILTGHPGQPAQRTPPMKAMDQVAAYVKQELAGATVPELKTWKNWITNKAKFVLVDLNTDGINRYLAFDAINSRGLPLSEFDKIKNFCILVNQVRTLAVAPDVEWYRAISHLESFGVGTRSLEDAFIAELFSVYHDDLTSQSEAHDAFVKKYHSLLTGPNAQLETDFKGFIGLWNDYAKSFGVVACPSRTGHYGTLCEAAAGQWLDCLDNLDLPTITRPILVSSHLRMSKAQFTEVSRTCEIYTFRTTPVMKLRKDGNAVAIHKLANEVLRNNKDDKHVKEQICGWLGRLAPLSKVIAKLGNGEAKYYFDPYVKGWPYTYYFLYQYEISCSPLGMPQMGWAKDKRTRRITIEHILPQSHRDKGWWEAHWPDEAKAERFKHRLGNLVLTADNRKLGRKSIEKKLLDVQGHWFTHANATNSEKVVKDFTDGKSWQTNEILKREARMLEFAAKRWSLPCCVDNGVIEYPESFEELKLPPIEIDEEGCFGGDVVEIAKAEEEEDEEGPQI